MEIKIEKPVPYIEEEDNLFKVVFVEPGTTYSCYEFNNLRDAKICANEVLPLVKESGFDYEMINTEVFEVEPLISETTDEYGFRTVTTAPWKQEVIVEIFDDEGNLITAEERDARIAKIEEERKLEELRLEEQRLEEEKSLEEESLSTSEE